MMHWARIKKLCLQYFAEMRWYTLMLALLFYALSSWCLLFIAGEHELLGLTDYVYWLLVTGSTVGYGDMSPTTPAGKWIVALWIIPVGLSIFALVVGRIASWVGDQWKKGARGLKTLSIENHILVVGWNEKQTLQLLKLLLKESEALTQKPEIVLCVKVEMENPLPGDIQFVRVSSFNKDEEMDKACILDAHTILINNLSDDLTMTTALYCSKRNPNAHKVAYLEDESLVSLLNQHCPEVECTPSVAVEMLAKSAFDPGSSLLHHDLLDVKEGQAQFSLEVPDKISEIKVEQLFIGLKTKYNATFIGYSLAKQTQQIRVNPELKETVNAGDKVFYIAETRINHIDWSNFD